MKYAPAAVCHVYIHVYLHQLGHFRGVRVGKYTTRIVHGAYDAGKLDCHDDIITVSSCNFHLELSLWTRISTGVHFLKRLFGGYSMTV